MHFARHSATFVQLFDLDRLSQLWRRAVATGGGAEPRINDDFRLVKRVRVGDVDWSAGLSALDDRELLADKLADGFTFVLNRLEMRDAALLDVCSRLSRALGARGSFCGINAYVSPPNAAGFALHNDQQDAFVAQIAGSKRWRLCGSFPALMAPWQEAKPPPEAARNCTSVLLHAGDTLFVPRGLVHDADTDGLAETSLHLTIGLQSDFLLACELLHALALVTDANEMHVAIRAAASTRAALRQTVLQTSDATDVRAAMDELRAFVLEHEQWPAVALPVVGLNVYATAATPTDAAAVLAWLARCDDSHLVAAAQRFEATLQHKAELLRANALGAIERANET